MLEVNFISVALCCAIFGTIVFLIKTFFPVDFGPEVTTDFNVMSETDASFNFLTIESISAFLMCSGWVGWYALNYMHLSTKLSVLIAAISGAIGMLFFVWLIAQFKKLEHIPTANPQELVNRIGKAYMNFSPKGSAKIQIEYHGELATLDAINESDVEIKAFENIKVVKVENNQIYIVKG
ncbi:MAG: NfeD family protein [Candidatus Gastranaerophilales bacterium]|nr:NfeD family protein [Candidatus Gastranaerophilales bacterium]